MVIKDNFTSDYYQIVTVLYKNRKNQNKKKNPE